MEAIENSKGTGKIPRVFLSPLIETAHFLHIKNEKLELSAMAISKKGGGEWKITLEKGGETKP